MDTGLVLITFGILLLVGLGLDALGRWTRLPRISLLVLFGIVIGPSCFDLLPIDAARWYGIVASIALTMVAFLLGGELSVPKLRAHGRSILVISSSVSLVTAAVITGGLLALGVSLSLALLLGAIGLATAPAAVHDVVRQNNAKGPFTECLLGVVAIDDAWGLIVFSLVLGVVAGINDVAGGAAFTAGLTELAASLGVGLAVGLPAAMISGRVRPGEPTLAEALGIVLLCTGLSLWLRLSFLLVGMTAGAVVVNLAKHHRHAFREIGHIEWPFMILFFVLAGAAVHLGALVEFGLVGAAYVALRVVGRVAGSRAGAGLADVPRHQAWLMGLALTPQAGVALGMALVASDTLPSLADEIVAVTIGTTIVFELVGPLLTQFVLHKVGEAKTNND